MARAVSGKKSAAQKATSKTGVKKAATAVAKKNAAAPSGGAAAKKAAEKRAAAAISASGKAPAKKAGTKTSTAAGRASVAKAATPKKAAARVPVIRRPPALRVRPAVPASRKAATPKTKAGTPQSFTVSHLNEADFKADGLRAYALYRDLGVAAATGGLCQAHVLRLLSPCTDEVRKRHLHEVELQMIYVLKGWIKNEFEGHGVQMMSTGSCWIQPSGVEHTVLDYSPDVELLEIVLPADFKTVELT